MRFLFEDTNYPRWLLNTLLVGAAVVGITLLLALPAGYALARLAGGWGQSAGIAIFLVYLVPPTLLFLRCPGSSHSSTSRTRYGR